MKRSYLTVISLGKYGAISGNKVVMAADDIAVNGRVSTAGQGHGNTERGWQPNKEFICVFRIYVKYITLSPRLTFCNELKMSCVHAISFSNIQPMHA
jgi:hypothetical protein